MSDFILKCMLLLCVFNHSTALVPIAKWSYSDEDFGPVINLFCTGSTYYRWTFANKTLAQDEELIDADPTRYSVSVGQVYSYGYANGYGSVFVIKNALKEDAGLYECQLDSYSTNNGETYQISVQVHNYLPPLSYPKCHISSSILYDESNVTFNCSVGESSASLNLLLTLQYQKGSIVELGYGAVTKTVTLSDNNAMFVCHMTSETFPTAYRNCSAGPITITTFVSNSSEGHNSNEIISTKMYFIYGIIVGTTAAFVLVLIGAIICITLRKFKLEENNPLHMPAIRDSDGDRHPSNQEISSDATSKQGNSEQTQAYDEIPEPISPNLSEGTITYAEADTNLSTIHEETVNFPIYSEVKEAEETDKSKNEADDEDSTGMVKNTIYVSSGPV